MTHSRTLVLSLLPALLVAPLASGQLQPTVQPEVRVDPGATTFSASETTGAASAANPDEIVLGWNDWRRSPSIQSEVISAGFALSLDGGATWSDFLIRPPAPNQSNVEGDPFTAADPRTGMLWAGAISFTGAQPGIYVASKAPGEAAFAPAVMARQVSGTDKPWMAAGPRPGEPETTRLYIAFNQGVIRSDDLGATWTAPVSLGSGIGFLPRVADDGTLYVSYWDFDDGVMLKRSLDGGLTFTTHRMATRLDVWGTQSGSRFPGTFRVPSMSYLAVCPVTGTLYACWFDTTSVAGGNMNVDLWMTRSTDQGDTWADPWIAIGGLGDQFFCWIECDDDGRLHLTWCDTRHVALQDDDATNGFFDSYYGFSVDGGTTWTQQRLTPSSWNSNNDGLDRPNQFIGDYFGMALAGNAVYPVYPDTSAGDPDVFTNRIDLPVVGDADGDGLVGFADLVALLAAWGPCATPPCPSDHDGDGDIDFEDLLIVLARWTA